MRSEVSERINKVFAGLSIGEVVTGITMSELEDHMETYGYEVTFTSSKASLYEGYATHKNMENITFSMHSDGETFIEAYV